MPRKGNIRIHSQSIKCDASKSARCELTHLQCYVTRQGICIPGSLRWNLVVPVLCCLNGLRNWSEKVKTYARSRGERACTPVDLPNLDSAPNVLKLAFCIRRSRSSFAADGKMTAPALSSNVSIHLHCSPQNLRLTMDLPNSDCCLQVHRALRFVPCSQRC